MFVLLMSSQRKSIRVLSAALVLSALLYGGYHLMRETDMSLPSLFQSPPGPRILMSMDGFRLAQSENGRISWRIAARRADLYENKEAQMKDIEIVFSSPEKKEASLIAERATMDTVTGNASLRRATREVKIVTSDGYLLTTNALFWKAKERTVKTDEPFKLLGTAVYLEGRGFSARVDMQEIEVRDNVKAVFQE